MRQTIVIAVGGTGGHVLPAGIIGRKLSERFDVVYIGVGLSTNPFFDKEGSRYFDVEGAGLKKGALHCGLKNISGIRQARKLLRTLKPTFVIGFGSFHSFPVLAAAAYLGIPYDLFEFNVVPGLVNRLFSRGARNVFLHFAPKRKKIKGNITFIDYAFEDEKIYRKEEALNHFGLQKDKKTILVFGGSQGAEAINDLMAKAAPLIKDEYQILHFPGKESDLKKYYDELHVTAHVHPFCNRMDLAWVAADIAICRSGAGALREILIYETPAILIPYPAAKDDHQTYNAKFIEELGAGICVRQNGLSSNDLIKTLIQIGENLPLMKSAIQSHKERVKNPNFLALI